VAQLFQVLLEWVQAHPLSAGLVVFAVAMAESLAVIGIIVPGVVIMFGIGALVATGAIEFWHAVGWAVAGAVAGDGLSFWLGRRFRHRVRELWPFHGHPRSLQQGVDFFNRYGGKSVALGRFVGPVRAIIPLVAGMLGMPPARFFVANLVSALAWAPAYLVPGMVFGASLELASQVAFRLVILLVLLAALAWLVVWLVHHIFRIVQPLAADWLRFVLDWSALHPEFGEIGRALADPNHPESRGLAIFASLLMLAMILAVALTGALLGTGWPSPLDHTLFEAVSSLRNPLADHFMLYLSRLGDASVAVPLILGVYLYLAVQRHWRAANYWLAAAGFAMLASVALKYALRIPRPDAGIEGLSPYAFPSTHAMRATVLYGFLAVMIARGLSAPRRWIPYSVAAILAVAVAASRVYLGAHWLSDVLASLILGLAWIAALGIAYHRHTRVESHWRGLALGSLALLVLAFSLQTWRCQEKDLARYTPEQATRTLAMADWWDGGWRSQPTLRQDTRGLNRHPLDFQYAGGLDVLAAQLELAGWRKATPVNWKSLLKLLSPSLPLQALPVLPQVHQGRHESLAMVKDLTPDRRVVIRLWDSNLRLDPGHAPLWIGNASIQARVERLGMIAYPVTTSSFDQALEALQNALVGLPTSRPDPDRQLVLARAPASMQPKRED
jgi:membrane protein DedA with SNARE-associated domain/membrane-associated phospholipid phosphatase